MGCHSHGWALLIVFILKVKFPIFFTPVIIVLSHYVTVIVFWFAATNRCHCVRAVWRFCLQGRSGPARILEIDAADFSETPVPAHQTVIPIFPGAKFEFNFTSAVLFKPARRHLVFSDTQSKYDFLKINVTKVTQFYIQ